MKSLTTTPATLLPQTPTPGITHIYHQVQFAKSFPCWFFVFEVNSLVVHTGLELYTVKDG